MKEKTSISCAIDVPSIYFLQQFSLSLFFYNLFEKLFPINLKFKILLIEKTCKTKYTKHMKFPNC